MTKFRMGWHLTPGMRVVCYCKAKAGLRCSPQGFHIHTQLSSLPELNLDSLLKTNWFHLAVLQCPVKNTTTPNGDNSGQMSLVAHIMGAVIPNVLRKGIDRHRGL